MNLLNGIALEDDVQSGGQVDADTQRHDGVICVDEFLPVARDSIQHECNAEFYNDDGNAVEHFEEEEPLLKSAFWVLRV